MRLISVMKVARWQVVGRVGGAGNAVAAWQARAQRPAGPCVVGCAANLSPCGGATFENRRRGENIITQYIRMGTMGGGVVQAVGGAMWPGRATGIAEGKEYMGLAMAETAAAEKRGVVWRPRRNRPAKCVRICEGRTVPAGARNARAQKRVAVALSAVLG